MRALENGLSADEPDAPWRTAAGNPAVAGTLSHELKIPLPAAQVLVARGYGDPAAAASFLNPRLADLTDPFLIGGIERASRLVNEAVRGGRRICVFGDYDADGLTATALLVRVLRSVGARVEAFLPHRHMDGYGLTVSALERCLAEARPDMLVTVDCGITGHDAVEMATKGGVSVVVTDHHEPGDRPVPAAAVVNPKLDSPESARELAGVGVAFKLCHGIVKHRMSGGSDKGIPDLREYLDLVAVGTVADIAPLTGENRILVRHGLARLNARRLPAWRAITDVAGVPGRIDTYHVSFVIAPRLNATGRMESADPSLELLLTDDDFRAASLAGLLDDANNERKAAEDAIMEESCRELDSRGGDRGFGIVVGGSDWHAGTVGIVASRLARRYGRPSVVVALDRESGVGRGSCRSACEMDMMAALGKCSDLLTGFGGHKAAAGITVPVAAFKAFADRFDGVCRELLAGSDLGRKLIIDAWVSPEDIGEGLLAAMSAMEPFGERNPAPVWGVRNATILGRPVVLRGKHLKFRVVAGAGSVPAIGFGMGEKPVPDGAIDMAFEIRENVFRGAREVQAQIRDLRPAAGRNAVS